MVSCIFYPTILCFPAGSQCEAKADIWIYVDVSESIDPEEFRIIKSFLTEIVNDFHIGPDNVQIGNIFTTIHTTASATITTTARLKSTHNTQIFTPQCENIQTQAQVLY